MKNVFKTILLLLLSLVMALPLGACQTKDGRENGETTASQEATQSGDESNGPVYKYDENGYVMDNLPDDLDFGGEDFTILTWTEWARYDFVVNENTTAPWSKELLERQWAVEERLGVSIKIELQPGSWDHRDDFFAKVEGDQLSNEKSSFDMINVYGPTMANLTVGGYISNINNLKYVDTDMPWWNRQQVESATVNDNLYFLTGDITPTTIQTLWGVFGNETLLRSYGHTNLYDLVYDGEWTIEKMKELALNNIGVNDNEVDIYGLAIGTSAQMALLHGAGIFMVETTDNGDYKLGHEVNSQKMDTVFATVQDLYLNHENVIHSVNLKTFAEQKAFFFVGGVGDMMTFSGQEGLEFIFMPMPKYDAAQTDYYTTTSLWNAMYGVPTKVANSEMSGAVLEALASNAHRALVPVVFEECFSSRFISDPEDAAMVQLVYDSLVYDPVTCWKPQRI